MLDIKLIRENPETVKKNLEKRRSDFPLDRLIDADKKWREHLYKAEQLKAQKNKVSIEINKEIKEGKKSADKIEEMKKLSHEIDEAEKVANMYEKEAKELLMKIPNMLHNDVPHGESDLSNIEIRKWGEIKKFDFDLKSHGDLTEALGVADFERGAKVSGSGFVYLKGDLVKLDLALVQFGLDFLLKKDYIPIKPPYMMRRKPYEGVTDLGDFETMMYKIDKEDLYLIATSEHPMAAMYMDEILDEKKLPIKYVGVSDCFRKEIGAHGVDTKGFFRMHQFNKVEQFIFCKPKDSWKLHEELIKNAEEIFQQLEIPYRIVDVCTGDIGTVAARKYDLETWSPRQNKYVEVVSCSNCTDYQARRLNIRYGKAGGKKDFLHTINSTAIATSRTLVAILENNQNKDGSIDVPKVLQPYMNGLKKIVAKKGP